MYEKLEALLKERNMTPYQLSKEVDIAQSSLSDWKTGRSHPKVEKLKILAEYFDVPITYFIE